MVEMKKVLLLGTTLLAVASSGIANASHSATDNYPYDFAHANSVTASGGSLGADPVQIHFGASSGPAGARPRGSFGFSGTAVSASGSLACLNVSGNTATLAGVVQIGNTLPVGTVVAFTVVDNPASGGQGTVTT